MRLNSVIMYAHELMRERVGMGDAVIDATLGNGNDALFLANLIGPQGKLFGFDIQQRAIEKTEEVLLRNGVLYPGIHLLEMNHAEMLDAIPEQLHGEFSGAMFNLGYLPGADHAKITKPETTLPALQAALSLLNQGGLMTIMIYPGHDGGQAEAEAIESWTAGLAQKRFQTLCYKFINQRNTPPYLIAVEKL